MTKEELEKEAEDYVKDLAFVFETDIVQRTVRERVKLALIDVLEPREKHIAELEAQIAEMKRCEICNHYRWESCNYHSNWVKQCKENGMKLFELKERICRD